MKNTLKAGGIAGIIHAACYFFAIIMYLFVLGPIIDADAEQYLAQLPEVLPSMYTWIFIGYMVSALCLVVVLVALYDLLKGQDDWLLKASVLFGLIWATLIVGSANLMLTDFIILPEFHSLDARNAEIVWYALKNVENGLVSGSEFIGGMWVLSLSLYSLRRSGTGFRTLPIFLNIIGLVSGMAGVISIVPFFNELGSMIFGFLMIPWFGWLGYAMIYKGKQQTT